jgi:hypothetical protein
MRYVTAFLAAAVMFVFSIFLLGVLVGQMFDGIKGKWGLIPLFGEIAIALALAGHTFRHSLKPPRSI